MAKVTKGVLCAVTVSFTKPTRTLLSGRTRQGQLTLSERTRQNCLTTLFLSPLCAIIAGDENEHHVAKVTKGVRYAVTVSFTCNEADAIVDPMVGKASTKNE